MVNSGGLICRDWGSYGGQVSIIDWVANGSFKGELEVVDKAGSGVGKLQLAVKFERPGVMTVW